jgi:hypothetical protein
MQGYIIDIKPVKDDDLIVSIITETSILTTYRFYGARHSTINIGYKIDFELEETRSSIPRLKDVIQLGFPWILDYEKMYCWQRFIKLFYPHLKDLEEIDAFYFYNLDNLVHVMIKQNALRAICGSYLTLLEHEGRLHTDYSCLICEQAITENISLVRGFIPVHSKCTYSKIFDFKIMREVFEENKLINLKEDEVEYLWNILLQGL